MEEPPLKTIVKFILILTLTALIWGIYQYSSENALEGHSGANNEVYYSLEGAWIQASNTPPIPKPKSLAINESYWDLIIQYDWCAKTAYKILLCESGGDSNAINWKDRHRGCNGSFGLFQMAGLYGTQEELLDPKTNVEKAYQLYSRNGGFKGTGLIVIIRFKGRIKHQF